MLQRPFAHPKVVVGVPVFNEARYIERTLASLQAQTRKDFLVLISDNASSDETSAICARFCEQDERFKYVRQSANIGSARNVQFLLESSASPYWVLMGGHDLVHERFLEHHMAFLDQNPTFSLSYSCIEWVDEDDRPIRVSDGGKFDCAAEHGLVRYVGTLHSGGECTAINGVIRRACLGAFRFDPIYGIDRVALHHLLYQGRFRRHETPLYRRRSFQARQSSSMERITGNKDASADFKALWRAFLRDYLALDAAPWQKALLLPWLILRLELSYGRGPVRLALAMRRGISRGSMRAVRS